MRLAAPVPLGPQHEVARFHSGIETLDAWLKQRAAKNQATGATRTYVVCDGFQVIGYYALASSAVAATDAIGKFRRNMPDPIPAVLLARLAVDQARQKQGLGRALLQDASRRVVVASDIVGVRGFLVQAISAEAAAFYERFGFSASPLDPMLSMATIADLKQAAG